MNTFENNSFNQNNTLVAKGIAITLMLIHHLFTFPERISNTSYLTILPFFPLKYNFEYYIGDFGKICVAVFIFLSGFGMCKSITKKPKNIFLYSIGKILSFFKTYWLCFIVFIPIGLIFFSNQSRYNFSLESFVFNFIGINTSYNGEWWFVKVYLLLLILFPFFFYLLKKSSFGLFFISFVGFILSERINFCSNFLFWQLAFVIGILFAYLNIFEKSEVLFNKKTNIFYSIGVCLLIFLARFRFGMDIDLFITPFFVYYSSAIFISRNIVNKLISFLGDYSFEIWLIHSFFCYYYFQNLVFFPKISILILFWLMVLSLGSAFIIRLVGNYLTKGFKVVFLKG